MILRKIVYLMWMNQKPTNWIIHMKYMFNGFVYNCNIVLFYVDKN